MDKYSWSKRHKKMIERTVCLPCWKKANPPRPPRRQKDEERKSNNTDETSALLIGALSSPAQPVDQEQRTPQVVPESHVSSLENGRKKVTLAHHIFDSDSGWKRAESMQHPTLTLRVAVKAVDYKVQYAVSQGDAHSYKGGNRYGCYVSSMGSKELSAVWIQNERPDTSGTHHACRKSRSH